VKSSSNLSDARVPAEWEPLQCVWLAWPHNPNTWPGQQDGLPRLSRIPEVFSQLVRAIAKSTAVNILATGSVADQAAQHVGGVAGVTIIPVATNDVWIRDYGPTFVQSRSSGEMHAVDWGYNAWGGKYPPWDDDAAAAAGICQSMQMRRCKSDLCVEGGAMEFDGDRRMMTTPMCLVGPTRNPKWDSQQISREIYRQTGVTEIVWIDGGGLEGDDTDGHIDQLARFIDRRNVVAAVAPKDDPNHDGLRQNFLQLELWANSTRPRVTIHPLMIPPARYVDETRVPESYCNFLRLGPDRILLPSFSPETDAAASETFSKLTDAKLEWIDCRDLVWGLGALHCCSRDQPAPKPPTVDR
jgi:agmatine deiminase